MASRPPGSSRLLAGFSALVLPLGLVALVAVGVHAAADRVDDHLLTCIEALDGWADGWLARWEWTSSWVHLVESPQRTLAARGLALVWELAVDALVALPLLGQDEAGSAAWRSLGRQPTPMRVLRPLETAVFSLGGSYAVARLVESTLFEGLVGDVAPAAVASALARAAGLGAMALVLASHGTRAVARALQHADGRCEVEVSARGRWLAGSLGTALALPLAVALALEARSWLAVLR
jgi:hypothetical protein